MSNKKHTKFRAFASLYITDKRTEKICTEAMELCREMENWKKEQK